MGQLVELGSRWTPLQNMKTLDGFFKFVSYYFYFWRAVCLLN